MNLDELNEKEVISSDAHDLGEVTGAHIDIDNWKITDLDIKLTSETIKKLNLKKPRFGSLVICLPVTDIKEVGDVIVLKYSLKSFRNLKACKSD